MVVGQLARRTYDDGIGTDGRDWNLFLKRRRFLPLKKLIFLSETAMTVRHSICGDLFRQRKTGAGG